MFERRTWSDRELCARVGFVTDSLERRHLSMAVMSRVDTRGVAGGSGEKLKEKRKLRNS